MAPQTGDVPLPGTATLRCLLRVSAHIVGITSKLVESIMVCHALRHKQETCRYLVQPPALFDANVSLHELNPFYSCCVM